MEYLIGLLVLAIGLVAGGSRADEVGEFLFGKVDKKAKNRD